MTRQAAAPVSAVLRARAAPLAHAFALVLAAALTLAATSAFAHKASDSYLILRADGAMLRGQWDIALRDLEHAIGLDADGNGEITWGELRARHGDIAAWALARLSLRVGGRPCALVPLAHLVDAHSDGAYAVLQFDADCGVAAAGREIAIGYSLLFDLDPTHRGLLRFEAGGEVQAGVFSPERPLLTVKPGERAPLQAFAAYLREGVWHIWIGIDHILFLLSLLLPAVFRPALRDREPLPRFGEAFWDVFRVVTAFTVAHSITLSLAALSVVSLPSRLVESVIALSVVLAALNNLRPVVTRRRWAVAFAFGLVHGFGFASVLADLGLPQDALLVSLLGFNLGVEGGQLAIVAGFLPLAWAARRTWAYRTLVFSGGSAFIAFVAFVWMIERALDLKLY